MRRILHPSDFSSASRPAFARAVALAKAERAELLLVHVISPFIPAASSESFISPRTYEEIQRASQAEAQKQLDRLAARAKAARVRVRTFVLEGATADRIAQAARSQRADMIVIGTHGRTGFTRLLLGSVAERVVGTAPCPVLTVRGK